MKEFVYLGAISEIMLFIDVSCGHDSEITITFKLSMGCVKFLAKESADIVGCLTVPTLTCLMQYYFAILSLVPSED